MSEPVVAARRLTYRYPDAVVPALDGVDVSIAPGELVLLAGPSASGKSTLLRAVSGLVPHFFGGELAGSVVVGGLETRRFGPAELSAVAGSVFQDPESQVVMGTVRAELELPLENRGAAASAAARSVEETAVALGIADLLDRTPETLSGGELQRVAIGAALVARPAVLLLDEPTSQLDPVAGDDLVLQLRRVNEEWGTTVIVAEQRVERWLPAADRVIAFEDGRVALDGTPREFVAWSTRRRPALAPPAARMFELAGVAPLPVGVKDARALLAARGLGDTDDPERGAPRPEDGRARMRLRGAARATRRRRAGEPALRLERIWVEYGTDGGAPLAALRGVALDLQPGERVALLGRNGAGKSTLLKVAAGVRRPDRGAARSSGEVALVVQDPASYFLHDRVIDELPPDAGERALAELGLASVADADPRDLSGGERQRLALAVVLAGRGVGGGRPPAVVALDEPTRGMDREQKRALALRLNELARDGAAVLLATHDVELAAEAAERCVLLGRGEVLADGPTVEVLSGGLYFSTEVARVLGAAARAVLPEDGARRLAERLRAHGREQGDVPLGPVGEGGRRP